MRILTLGMAVLAGSVTLFGSLARGQSRVEISPFGGYETSASYPVNVFGGPSGTPLPVSQLRINGSLAYGTFVDYSLTENFQLEFMWNQNNTSYSAQNARTGIYSYAFHSYVDQFQFGTLYMFRTSDDRLRPYLAGSLGFTHDTNGNGTPDQTNFSFSIGGGVKYFVNRHIGLRADARYLPTYANSSNQVFCYYGCFVGSVPNYLNRGSFTGGIIFKF